MTSTSPAGSFNFPEFIKTHTKAILAFILVIALVIIGASIYGFYNNTRNEGIDQESALVAQYKDNQNELSAYILTFNETLGIADRQSKTLNTIILDAVKGRYDGNLEPGTSGGLFSAISESYPDLTENTKLYAKVQDAVSTGRTAYKNKQSLLLDRIRHYENWQNQGIFKSAAVKQLGFPSTRLAVEANGRTLTGQAALDQIKQLVLTSDAREAYDTGEQAPLITPQDLSPTPAK